jgi:hypothetical protein
MGEVFPWHVLSVLGSGLDLAEMEGIAAGFGGFVLDRECSEAAPDPRMPEPLRRLGAAADPRRSRALQLRHAPARCSAVEIEPGEDDLFFNPYGYVRLTQPG